MNTQEIDKKSVVDRGEVIELIRKKSVKRGAPARIFEDFDASDASICGGGMRPPSHCAGGIAAEVPIVL
jgi:hypothetical protein